MQYRDFSKVGWKASALGFGAMRLPTVDGDRMSPNIREDEATRMIRHAIDSGVNYVDTAYPYHGGASEVVVGRALKNGYRERVKLATKLPTWLVTCAEDFDRLLDEQLGRLQTDHIDCYILHALNSPRWELVMKQNLLARAEAAKADGRIRHVGFSFHGQYEEFEQILCGYEGWDFCQIQYNYMDTENQAGVRGLKLAAKRGVAVIVMEPLLGGRLADPPADVRAAMEGFAAERGAADWALQWLWDQPEVAVVLSGMTTMQQLEENLRSAEASRIGSFTEPEQQVIATAAAHYRKRIAVPCTRCNYCLPCPNDVNIPQNFDFFNYAHLFDDVAGAKFRYSVFLPEAERASACIACGECEQKCPQEIAISEWMPKVAALLEPVP